jgi:methylenetetrahydrofolate reductase (NADPH)
MAVGRSRGLTVRERAALARALETATFELLPLKSVREQIASLPGGARVSVTASPGKGLEATIDLAAELHATGFQAVPHLSARMVRDRAHLRLLLARLADAGLEHAFVVGGDATDPGAFPDGLSLLRALADSGARLASIGIPCYPDGHAFIPDARLLAALREKSIFASYMTTQLCFDARTIAGWLAARRAEGLLLPAVIGVPGVTEPHRLLAISARIGVRDSKRFLQKNLGLVARLVRSAGFYRPDGLLNALAPLFADPDARIRGVHMYTFNQVATTEAWRTARLAALRPASDDPHAGEPWVSSGPGAGWLTGGDS